MLLQCYLKKCDTDIYEDWIQLDYDDNSIKYTGVRIKPKCKSYFENKPTL